MVPQFPHLSFGFGIRMASLCEGGTKSPVVAVVMRSGSGRGGPGESMSASVLTQHSIYTEELNPALNLAGIMVVDGGWGGSSCLHTDSRTMAVETGRRRQCPANTQPRALRNGIFMNSRIFWLTKVLILWV